MNFDKLRDTILIVVGVLFTTLPIFGINIPFAEGEAETFISSGFGILGAILAGFGAGVKRTKVKAIPTKTGEAPTGL